MATVRTRKDAWKLSSSDETLLWYGRAVAEMRKRPFTDPTSWRFQAAIHDYKPEQDPLASPDDPPPSEDEQKRFWLKCQHATWFFLPWHRMYLTYFERMVAAIVAQLNGPADWALPYWNYSDSNNPDARRLPPAFRDENLPDGSPNPLYVKERDAGNAGEEVATPRMVSLKCLTESDFEADPMGGSSGFGGPGPDPNHDDAGRIGSLEGTPHGSMHNAVGGWMGEFFTAGLDPIFWLHHSNIDRLWQVWRNRDRRHQDPPDASWQTTVTFEFNDGSGGVVALSPSQVVDTTAAPLSYKYEDVSDPLGAAPQPLLESVPVLSMAKTIPEMIGATEKPVALRGQVATTSFAVSPPTGPAAILESASPRKMYLNFENVTGDGKAIVYAVYLNLPAGADPDNHQELFAGLLPMFGVEHASEPTRQHPGGGLHYTLEVGDVIRTLQSKNAWDSGNVRITFVPESPRARLEAISVSASGPIQVGRVSLYTA
jgi:tyrosinase